MKATLEFDLPEESQEHQDAVDGGRWRSAVTQLREEVHAKRKHGHDFKTPDEVLEWIAAVIAEEQEDIHPV